MKAPISLM